MSRWRVEAVDGGLQCGGVLKTLLGGATPDKSHKNKQTHQVERAEGGIAQLQSKLICHQHLAPLSGINNKNNNNRP